MTTQLTRVRHHTGFWFVAAAFASLMAFGTVPMPLWPLYTTRDHLSSTQVTVAFAVMVVGTALSLHFGGHLSDRLGRRRIIIPALGLGLAAAIVMAVWPDLPGLLVGRVLTGLGVGLMASTATSYLTDLHHEAHPDQPTSRLPATVATAANLGGLALGPLLAGALAEWIPFPLVTPYAVLGVLMAIGVVAIALSPETVDRLAAAAPGTKFLLRDGKRGTFASAAALAFVSFGIFGIFGGLGALIVRGNLHITSPWIWGVAATVVLAVSAVAQVALAALPHRRMLALGVTSAAIGLVLVWLSTQHPSLALYLVGAALSGAGAGLLFKAAISSAMSTADPTSRAGVLSVFFIVAYLGMGLPPILLALISM
jgi:MFS family permease